MSVLLAEFTTGSRAFGMHRPDSDIDLLVVTVELPQYYLGITEPARKRQVIEDGVDTVTMDIKHFMWELAKGNPNSVNALLSYGQRLVRPVAVHHPVFKQVLGSAPIFCSRDYINATFGLTTRLQTEYLTTGKSKPYMQAIRHLRIAVDALAWGSIREDETWKLIKRLTVEDFDVTAADHLFRLYLDSLRELESVRELPTKERVFEVANQLCVGVINSL